jgi:signal transduction histidine kinase
MTRKRPGFQKSTAWIWIVLVSFFLTGSSRGSSLEIRVGLYENPPKVFTSESGEPAGIFVDIIEAIAEGEGWSLQFVPGTWSEGLARLDSGEIDLMPDVAFTPQREALYGFHTEPVLSDWFQVYAAPGSGIHSILDLDGRRVVVLEGSVQQDAFLEIVEGFSLSMTLSALPDYDSMFEAVSAGDADAAITNRFYGARNASSFGLEETAVIFNPTQLFFAASAGAPPELLETIDRYLTEMKHDPNSVYYASLARWISQEPPILIPEWVRILLAVTVTALTISVAGSVLMKRQIRFRTRQLRLLNREMEQRIITRTAELEVAMERARESDTLKSAFLATMSHELRTPLNSIIGFTGILIQELAGPLIEEQRKQLGMVQSSARHLLALINDVLDISKIEAGQLDLSLSPVDVRASIENTARVIAPLAHRKGLSLEVHIDPGTSVITTDQRRLEQIVLNLLSNAVKFTERGEVAVSCSQSAESLVVTVSDTGIGIEEKDMHLLFEPFQQVDTGLTRKHEGTGLGLSICRRILDIMGGSIEVESTPGKGSLFTVTIPDVKGGSLEQHVASHRGQSE